MAATVADVTDEEVIRKGRKIEKEIESLEGRLDDAKETVKSLKQAFDDKVTELRQLHTPTPLFDRNTGEDV